MRVIHVSPYFNFPDQGPVGGVLLYVYELSKALAKKGCEVAVYTSGDCVDGFVRKSQKTLEVREGIEVHRVPSFDELSLPYLFPRLENPIPFPSFSSSLSKEGDVIHIHGHEYATSYLASRVAKKHGIPSVLSVLSTAEALQEFCAIRFLRKALDHTAFAFTVNSARTVIAPTRQALQVLRKFNPRRVVAVPLGIDLERFSNLKNERDYVLFLGRLEQTKRPEDFIKAIPLVLEKVKTTFVIAGTGIQLDYLKSLVRRLGVEKYVSFAGWVPYYKVPRLIASASIIVAPGNAGYSILEAAAARKPIISARLDWNIDCIGKGAALFFKEGDIKELAEAIVKVLLDDRLSESLAEKSYMNVRKRSWDALIRHFLSIYEDTVKRID